MHTQRRFGVTVLGLALTAGLATTTGPARAGVIVVPNAQTATEGNDDNGYPFNIANFGLNSQRYQQVYNASDFLAAFGGGPKLITQIAFRPNPDVGSSFSSTLPNVQIDLSTTSKTADGLSTTFAANVGADDTVVHSGPLSLSSAFTGPASGPKDFDIVISLTTPFLYDPTKGNLLLDVRNFGGGFTTQFDAEQFTGDAISRVFTNDANGVNDATGSPDTVGLVTQFTFQPAAAVPEPSSLALLGLGAGALAGWRRWRNRKPTTA